MKKVFKYGTGHEVPDGAVYLCTKTETVTLIQRDTVEREERIKKNHLVWHYFLITT